MSMRQSIRHSPRRAALVVIAALAGPNWVAAKDPPTDTNGALNTIRQVTTERNRQLESLYIRYQMSSAMNGDPADAKRYLRVLFLVDEEKTLAIKGTKRYSRESRATTTVTDIAPGVVAPPAPGEKPQVGKAGEEKSRQAKSASPPGQIKLMKEYTRAFDGKVLRRMHKDGNFIELLGEPNYSSPEGDSGFFNYEYLTTAFDALPDTINPKKTHADRRFPDVLDTAPVKVRPDPEPIDGANCVVLEIGPSFVVWVDPALGYAVRRWDYRDPKSGYVLCRNALAEFTQITPAFWFPRVASYTFFAPLDAPEAVKKVLAVTWTMRATELHANDVPDSLFTLATPPGIQVVDHTNAVMGANNLPVAAVYTMPASPGELDAVIAKSRAETEGLIKEFNQPKKWGTGRYLLIGFAAITLTVVAFVGYRLRSQRAVA